ncbi:type II secretion system F family protein [Marinomonas sp. C2222]|uniref:General secretion pathway protein F n=1 Tax=Marinomonas sargassi TaxID=2984494 RepID=A0ABT2YNJ1_9GAMM|nr:type II secretion system F family protein [Marinomonas sargassi]MCV2401454.1 type II secretion system F family protein [Marinomonas sargassi]
MNTFAYTAVDAAGKKVKGTLEATSEADLRQKIRDKGLVPIQIKATHSATKNKKHSYAMNPKQRSILFRTLSTLVSPNLPLDQAMVIAAEQTKDKSMRKMIDNTTKAVREGKTLSSALGDYPKSFPPLYLASIEASEESGTLNKVLLRLAEHSENHYSNNQKIKLAMLYPSILVTLSLLITGYLLGFVMPDIVDTYQDQSQALPPLTSVMMTLSQLLVTYWAWIILSLAALIAVYSLLSRKANIRLKIDQFKLCLPLLGKVIKTIESTNYISTLSMLVNAGIPLSQAMSISGASLSNKEIKDRLEGVLSEVSKGKTLSKQLRDTNILPSMMMHLIESGERSEQLGAMLEKACVEQSKEIHNITNAAISLINPILLIFMGGAVLLIALAIMLPIMNMSSFIG